MARGADQEQRALTASMLLTLLKMNGCAAREAASYVGASPTTISHWQAASSAEGKSIGAPSDEQLQKLVGLLRARFEMNTFAMMSFVTSEYLRRREQALVVKALTPLLEQTLGYLQEQQAKLDKLRDLLVEMKEQLGPDAGRLLLAPIHTAYGKDWPSAQELAAHEATTGDVDPDSAIADLDVSETEMEKLKADYAAYTQQLQARIRAMMLGKAKRKQTAKKPTAKKKR